MMRGEGSFVNKLNCFFIFLCISFSAAAEEQRVLTLVPANRMDFNAIVREAPNADCQDQNQAPIGAFRVDVNRLDETMRNRVAQPDTEFEVNGQRFVPLMRPLNERKGPEIDFIDNDSGYLALTTSGLKFQVHKLSGKVDGKRIRFSIPLN